MRRCLMRPVPVPIFVFAIKGMAFCRIPCAFLQKMNCNGKDNAFLWNFVHFALAILQVRAYNISC